MSVRSRRLFRFVREGDRPSRLRAVPVALAACPLKTGEKETRCTHLFYVQVGAEYCDYYAKFECDGCEYFKETAPTNGARLIKTSRGWKAVGQDRRFALGIRERCEDPSF